MNRDGLQLSVAPLFEFLPRNGAADREVTDDVDAWIIPVQLEYQFDRWRVNGQISYTTAHDASDEWGYGIAAAFPLNERLEVMAEISGNADREYDEHGTAYLFGFDLAFTDTLHLLGSAGASVHETGNDDVDLQTYLGLQWTH